MVLDTKHTSPEGLRDLYRAPLNPLQNIDDQAALQTAINVAVTQPVSSITGTSASVGSSSGGSGGGGCPAFGQYALARDIRTVDSLEMMLVENLRPFVDALWNQITKTFKTVVAIKYLRNVDCVKYSTFAGAESVVTYSHPVIQSFTDEKGTAIQDLIGQPDASHKAISCIDFKETETMVERISSVGKRDAVVIALAGGGIYFSGTDPYKLNAGHNKISTDSIFDSFLQT